MSNPTGSDLVEDMFGYLFARPAIKMALRKFDPRKNNGAILLGLNGITVKSHGSADGKSFANAIKVAATLVDEKINDKIIEELAKHDTPAPHLHVVSQQ